MMKGKREKSKKNQVEKNPIKEPQTKLIDRHD